MNKTLRVLIVEDSENDALLLVRKLRQGGYEPVFERVSSPDAMNAALDRQEWDIVIADYVMPRFSGFEALILHNEKGIDIPFIIVTGKISEENAVEIMKAGAHDYIMKSNLSRLVPAIERELRDAQVRRAHNRLVNDLTAATKQWKNTFDSITDFVSVNDKDFRFVKVNKALSDLLGMKPDDLVGKHCYELLHNLDHPDPDCPHIDALRSGKTVTKETYNPKLKRHLTITVSPVIDEKGGLEGTVHYIKDITKRRMAEEALRKSERGLKEAQRVAQLGNWQFDLINNGLTWSDEIYEIFGLKSGQFKGTYEAFLNMVHPEDREFVDRSYKNSVINNTAYDIVHRIVRPDGEIRYVHEKCEDIKDETGKRIRSIGTIQDITERKNLESRLIDLHKMKALDQITRAIAHDFNNILAALTGYGTLLKMKRGKDDAIAWHVNQILALTDQAAGLTQSLFSFGKNQIFTPKQENLNEIIRKTEKLILMLVGKEIELKLKFTDKDLFVTADKGRLEQVMINLVTNARDAMPGGGLLTIETSLVKICNDLSRPHCVGKPGKYALVSVKDTGTGMDEETREKIFELFLGAREIGNGIGLGLSIANEIIRQHNGFIDVSSEHGKGTTIDIYLPLVEQAVEEGAVASVGEPIGGTETILVAEDQANVRKSIKTVLEEFGYGVIEAVDGKDALEKFSRNRDRVQLVLLDVVMPGKNGKQAFAEIKKIRPDTKALFLSGYSLDDLHEKGIYEEGIKLLQKPVSPQDLLRKIREVLVS
ncbi:blue-light-activated protein [bacterium BMS3Abin10]|nr:blue-light-activated protein [bacterium BMS3Abin10]